MSTKRKKKKQIERVLKLMGDGSRKNISMEFVPSSLPGFNAHKTLFIDADMMNLNCSISPAMAEPVTALNKILDKYV